MVFRTCANQTIQIPFSLVGTKYESYLRARDNHSISLPNATISYQNQITDSVYTTIHWNVGNDTGWHYVFFQVADSACALSPYIQEYTYLFKIYVSSQEKLYAHADTSICAGQPVQLSAIGAGNASLNWSVLSGDMNSLSCNYCPSPTVNPNQTTVYVVQLNALSCFVGDTVVVNVKPGFNLHVKDTSLCSPTKTITLSCGTSGANAGLTYNWQPIGAIIGGNQSPQVVVDPNIDTVFVVTVSDTIGCYTKTDTILIHYDKDFNPFIFTAKDGICLGDSTQLQVFGVGNAHITWSPNYHISDIYAGSVSVWPDSSVTYTAKVQSNASSCMALLNKTIDVVQLHADAGPDYDIYDGEEVTLGGVNMRCNNGCNVKWFPDKWMFFNYYLNPKVVPHETTKYWVVLSNDWGTCVGRDTVEVRVTCDDVYMPNVFSPESQEDKLFGPKNVGLEYNYFYIFNRWGEQVFTSYRNNERWDGKYKGVEQPTGVYVWIIEAKCPNGQWIRRKGNVTLVR